MLSVLGASVLDQTAEFKRRFDAAQPFCHVVIDDFLEPSFCRELIDAFPSFPGHAAFNERGELGGKAVVPDIAAIGPAYRAFDSLMKDPQFLALVSEITGIPVLVYDPEYIGGGTHDNQGGQELDVHVDFNYHPSTGMHRRLNLILFLNPEWDESWGGNLELLREPFASGDDVKTVIPLANRAVIFETTENSWHGFRRIVLPPGKQTSRRSLAVYFYTKERPARQIAPSHATFYYQRPLPAHIQPGYTLRDEDVLELQILLKRRDTHLKFMYEREQDHSRALEQSQSRMVKMQANEEEATRQLAEHIAEHQKVLRAIDRSPSVRLGKAITWPARKLRSLRRRDGV